MHGAHLTAKMGHNRHIATRPV